jgi:hypothetical protein
MRMQVTEGKVDMRVLPDADLTEEVRHIECRGLAMLRCMGFRSICSLCSAMRCIGEPANQDARLLLVHWASSATAFSTNHLHKGTWCTRRTAC